MKNKIILPRYSLIHLLFSLCMPRKPRIVIPKNPGELMKLTGDVYARHKELGKDSPLRLLEDPSWDELAPKVAEALAAQTEIEKLERHLKDLYGIRDPHLALFSEQDRRSRDTLMGVHSKNPAQLGDYGFDVIASAAPKGPAALKK